MSSFVMWRLSGWVPARGRPVSGGRAAAQDEPGHGVLLGVTQRCECLLQVGRKRGRGRNQVRKLVDNDRRGPVFAEPEKLIESLPVPGEGHGLPQSAVGSIRRAEVGQILRF
jgi:hypothetical protein